MNDVDPLRAGAVVFDENAKGMSMANVTRRIGLSLGADICWPICYEEILQRLDLAIPVDRDIVRFEVDRVTIEPFDLRQPCRYDLVIDRLTHWYHTSREWIKKAVIMDGLYVFNNPWAVQSMEKHSTYCAMMRLGFPIPATWMLPPKHYEPTPDLQPTLERYAKLFDLDAIGNGIGYPMFMKPYDGGGWAGVSRIDDPAALRHAYDQSGTRVMHLQRSVDRYDAFVRCIGLGPQTYCVKYDPSAPLHSRYTMERDFIAPADEAMLRDMTLTINTFFNWDFNSCESLRQDGIWHPIDFANPCPDSQVTSLHYHFPWLVKANIRWSLFCAATKRPMRMNMDWQPFFDVLKKDGSFPEHLAEFGKIARQRLAADEFEAFCARHLSHLDQVTWEFFATDRAMDAVRQKVAALYPAHEVEMFTTLFWNRIQHWRETEGMPAPRNDGAGSETRAARKSTAADGSAGGAAATATSGSLPVAAVVAPSPVAAKPAAAKPAPAIAQPIAKDKAAAPRKPVPSKAAVKPATKSAAPSRPREKS